MPTVWPGRKKVELITDARQSPLENHLHRKKVYNILQGLRVPVLVSSGAALLLLDNKVLAAILMLISVPLPWVAVVIGNGAGEPHDNRTRQVYKPMAARQAAASAHQLESSTASALPAGGGATSSRVPVVIEPDPWVVPGGVGPVVIDHEDEVQPAPREESTRSDRSAAGDGVVVETPVTDAATDPTTSTATNPNPEHDGARPARPGDGAPAPGSTDPKPAHEASAPADDAAVADRHARQDPPRPTGGFFT